MTGWCDTRDTHNGGYDHPLRADCRNFISDAEHTAQLMRDAQECDHKVQIRYPSGATTPAAAYIDEHRPY